MTDPAIQLNDLTRKFGSLVAVNRLDLCVNEGDIYGFLGPNGAGKTTAIRCMLGLIPFHHGDIRLFGSNDLIGARNKVGAIVETPAFHTWMSGRENLEQACAYGGISPAATPSEIQRVLERVGLTERAHSPVKTYSLGMKQRLAIARALLGRPKLLILDEPTNGLDPKGMHEVRELVRSLALTEQITVFISSHLLAEVQAICNRVGIIHEGNLRAEGDVQELLMEAEQPHLLEVRSTQVEQLKSVLAAMEDIQVVGPGTHGSIRINHRDVSVPELNRRLVEHGVPIDALIPVGRDLEDVFLEVTK